jgi:hypothetical protein
VEVVVDLGAVTVVVAHPEELATLSVRVAAPPTASPAVPEDVHRLSDVLEAAHTGRVGSDGSAFVDPAALRFHAAGQVDDGWEVGFSRMLELAAEHGWVAEDGYLQAHVTWPGGPEG